MTKRPKQRPDLGQQHLDTIRSFVLRARRVKEHSLSNEGNLLFELQSPKFEVELDRDAGEVKFTYEFPPEEQMESAAARVRPMILTTEPTFHAKVMNALLFFANHAAYDERGIETLRWVKKQWQLTDPHGRGANHYTLVSKLGEGEEVRVGDNVLAFAWIYGDVVHADTARRTETRRYGVQSRYRAAVPVIARLMNLTMLTLWITQQMAQEGSLPDLSAEFEEEVVVRGRRIRAEGTFWFRIPKEGEEPIDTPMGEEEASGEWFNAEQLGEHLRRLEADD